jgi:prepilin-type N-terminal cleavage/methylation domain-containing protein
MNSKGFTLIELLVVVAIIGILAAVGVVAYNGYTASAKLTVSKSKFSEVSKSIKLNYLKCEMNPSDRLKFASFSGGPIWNSSCSQFNEGNFMDGWFDQGKCYDLYYGYASTTCRIGIATSSSTQGIIHLKGKNQTGNGCVTLSMNLNKEILKEEICQSN